MKAPHCYPRGAPPGAGLRRCLGQSGLGPGAGRARAGRRRKPRASAIACRPDECRCAQQSRSGADAPGPACRGRGGAAPGAGTAARLCPAAQQHPVLPQLPPGVCRRKRFSPSTGAGTGSMPCRCCPRIPASNSIARRSGDCASAMSRLTSVSTRSRCSRSRCWRRMTVPRSNCTAMRKSRRRTR